jgi:hypothetical protein
MLPNLKTRLKQLKQHLMQLAANGQHTWRSIRPGSTKEKIPGLQRV